MDRKDKPHKNSASSSSSSAASMAALAAAAAAGEGGAAAMPSPMEEDKKPWLVAASSLVQVAGSSSASASASAAAGGSGASSSSSNLVPPAAARRGAVRAGGVEAGAGGGGGGPRCQVERCGIDLSEAGRYNRRHKVCPAHSKEPVVLVAGLRQRFCQQCSRFHELTAFDDAKRSCRHRLAGHNERRRKSSADANGHGDQNCRHAGHDGRGHPGSGNPPFQIR